MREGDVVRVVKPRPVTGGVFIDILGDVGWIEEVMDVDGVPWAQIQTLHLDGSPSGCGGIPLDCLALETAPQWREAKDKRDARFERDRQEGLERAKRWHDRVARVAARHDVTPDVAAAIHADLSGEDYE